MILALPIGTAVTAVTAVLFGAPTRYQSWSGTLQWAFLFSALTVAPSFWVLGTNKENWRRLFFFGKPIKNSEILVYFSVHGGVVGAWVGAMPMPLDWNQPWQEWPICCTIGTLLGYFCGVFIALIYILIQNKSSQNPIFSPRKRTTR